MTTMIKHPAFLVECRSYEDGRVTQLRGPVGNHDKQTIVYRMLKVINHNLQFITVKHGVMIDVDADTMKKQRTMFIKIIDISNGVIVKQIGPIGNTPRSRMCDVFETELDLIKYQLTYSEEIEEDGVIRVETTYYNPETLKWELR